MVKSPKLVDLVLAKLQETRHEEFTAVHDLVIDTLLGSDYHRFYMNNIYLGEVHAQEVIMTIPEVDDRLGPEIVTFHCADPKFFEILLNTTKRITQRHIELAEEGIQRAQYFRW